MNDLSKRLLVALIGIPISIYLVLTGGIPFTSVIAILSSITLWEFYKLNIKKSVFPHVKFGITVNIIIIIGIYYSITYPLLISNFVVVIFVLCLIALIGLSLSLWSKNPNPMMNFAVTISGLLYVTFSFSFVILLREFFASETQSNSHINSHTSALILLCTIFSIWICDSAAYFVGKSIGKNKLFPSVSPKKTWEGSIGGFAGAILSMIGFSYIPFLLSAFPITHSIAIGVIVGIVGQIGDLAESKLKRDADVKDSSSLLPGHGGALDRFDSILFVIPTVFIYLYIVFIILGK